MGIGTAEPEQKLNVIGNVQIGSDYFQPALPQGLNYRLSVDGQVVAKQVIVTLNDWSDNVFSKDYQLVSLEQLEKEIDKLRHLPDIPSEKEIMSNGLDVGEMQKLLLKKIEELTLYVIELNNKNKSQQKEIEKLLNLIINK